MTPFSLKRCVWLKRMQVYRRCLVPDFRLKLDLQNLLENLEDQKLKQPLELICNLQEVIVQLQVRSSLEGRTKTLGRLAESTGFSLLLPATFRGVLEHSLCLLFPFVKYPIVSSVYFVQCCAP